MPEIRHIAFYIITSRKGDDMKQGVFWLIDNKLLAIRLIKVNIPTALQNREIHTITKNCGNMLSPKIATSRIITTLVVELSKELKAKRLFI